MARPKGEFDWPLADEEFERHVNLLLEDADTFLLGRTTYEMFANYWPTALPSSTGVAKGPAGSQFTVPTSASDVHSEVARKMNSYKKIVFSRTLGAATWSNSEIARKLRKDEIARMKKQPGKEMIILGSGGLASSFTRLNLIDEYRIWLNPVILGTGKPLFGVLPERRWLTLKAVKSFASGLVSLTYETKDRVRPP